MAALERTCVGCRQVRQRAALVRLVRLPDGTVAVDRARAAGRGAYVHADASCLEAARRRLAGALRAERVDFDRIKEGVLSAGRSGPDGS
jgi:hypothetical protein